MTAPRTAPSVCILALEESSAAVIYGIYEVLSTFGNAWSSAMPEDRVDAPFDVQIVAQTADLFRCHGGAPVAPHGDLKSAGAADFVIITDLAVDPDGDHRKRWPGVAAWLREMASRGTTICSVCSGSVLLAAAGLLDGRPSTTHWLYVDYFRRFHPEVDLKPSRILVDTGPDDRIVTAGGMAAWEDLVLYIMARCHGEGAAIRAAKLFLFGDHSEGQLLYAARRMPKRHEDAAISRVQAWVAEHYSTPNCVSRMVSESGLAERTFKRRFRRATGYAPVAYVQTLRIEEAKQLLESTGEAIDSVARMVGYEDPTSFRRLFKRETGVTPARYRQRYQNISTILS